MRDKIVDEVLSRYSLTSDEQYEVADAIMGLLRLCPTITWAALPYMSNDFPVRRYALVLLPEEDE